MNDLMQGLQAPFKACEIEWRVGSTTKDKSKGLALAYVTNRAIQNRLDDMFGVFGWRNDYREWKGKGQLCGISIWDDEKKEWITKWDGADDSNMEATKGGLSDAMKRAAYQWGIGRYLYKLPATWAKLKPQGSSYVLAETPNLPKWALPEGYEPEGKDKVTSKDAEDVFDPAPDINFNDDEPADETKCSACGDDMTAGQIKVSSKKYGKLLCPTCQKEVT